MISKLPRDDEDDTVCLRSNAGCQGRYISEAVTLRRRRGAEMEPVVV